ncbi:unnamed protein product [Rotaria socialis]
MFHVILAVGFSFVYIIHSVPCVMALDQEQPIDINGSLFVKPGVGKTFRALHFPNATRTFKLRGNQTNNLFTLIEGKIQIGEGPKLHVHHNEDETFRVIRGQLQFIIGNETFCAPTGSVVYGRRGINMSFINVDSPDAYIEFLFSPSGIEHYFDEVSAVYTTVPYNASEADAVANKYGMDMFGFPNWKDIGCITPKTNDAACISVSFLFMFCIFSTLFMFMNIIKVFE